MRIESWLSTELSDWKKFDNPFLAKVFPSDFAGNIQQVKKGWIVRMIYGFWTTLKNLLQHYVTSKKEREKKDFYCCKEVFIT